MYEQQRAKPTIAPAATPTPAPPVVDALGNAENARRAGFGVEEPLADVDGLGLDGGAGRAEAPPPEEPGACPASPHEGQRLGTWIGVFDVPLVGGALVDREATSAAALAVAKARGPAVVVQDGKEFAVLSLVVDSLWTFDRDGVMAGDDATTVRVEHPDVYAFTTADGWPLLGVACAAPGASAATQQRDPTVATDADPVEAFRDGLGDGLGEVEDADLLGAFDVALRDLALHAIAQGEAEARAQLDALVGGFDPEAEATLLRAAQEWRALDEADATARARLNVPKIPPFLPGFGLLALLSAGPPVPFQVVADVAREQEGVRLRRHLLQSAFPVLARIDVDAFIDAPDTRAASVQDAYLRVIDGTAAARDDLAEDAGVLWSCPELVAAAIASLGLAPERAEAVRGEASRRATVQALTDLALGALGFGLAVAGTLVSGGALGAAVFGLGIGVNGAMVADQPGQAVVHGHLANTDIDPSEALLNPDDVRGEWLWVTVGLIGLVLDIGAVGSIVHDLRAAHSLEDAVQTARRIAVVEPSADEIRSVLRAQGVSEELIGQAGSARQGEAAATGLLASTTSALTRSQAIDLLGVPTRAASGASVHIDYVVDGLGGVTSISVRVGATASPEIIQLHAKVVRQLERYRGLFGRLRALVDRVRGLGPLSPGFEAKIELEKLAEAWKLTATKLAGTSFDDAGHARLVGDLDALEGQLATHQKRLDTKAPSTGTIAAELPDDERGMRSMMRRDASPPGAEEGDLAGVEATIGRGVHVITPAAPLRPGATAEEVEQALAATGSGDLEGLEVAWQRLSAPPGGGDLYARAATLLDTPMSPEALRQALKREVVEAIVADATASSDDSAARLVRLRRLTATLDNQTKGSAHEAWELAHAGPGARAQTVVRAEVVQAQGFAAEGSKLDLLKPQRADAWSPGLEARLSAEGYPPEVIAEVRAAGRLEIGEIREVKAGRIGAADLERLEKYVEFVTKEPPLIVGAFRTEKLTLVLHDPEAIRSAGVAERLADLLERGVLTLEWFDDAGRAVSYSAGDVAAFGTRVRR